ncbi:MAG: HD domain-containing protein [Desulfobacter sp.]|nr:MAG: HD domain-containing protein [Desulfobacter sp.]
MGLATEYFDDGSSFFTIDPLSINPESLAEFSLFERQAHKKGQYRFRCLLMNTRSIERERLLALIGNWDVVYIHRREAEAYRAYLRKNLEFILDHGQISVKQKTETLVATSSEVIKEAFSRQFASKEDLESMVQNVEKLVSRALHFIADIKSLNGIAGLINHDYDTHTHSIKVGWLTAVFINANPALFGNPDAGQMQDLITEATVAGFLHDLGKTKIPGNVINKPGRLDNLEYVLMQSHSAYGAGLLFDSPLSRRAVQTILYHHENEDGSGYPCGLSGDDIPIMAKICHIVDVFDALTSKRSYKAAKTPFEALKIMAGENPYLETLKQFEDEVRENRRPPVETVVRDDYEAKLRRLREREMLEAEAAKRVKARVTLRDKGMAHCFDLELLKRFIVTMNRSESFDLSGLL